MSLACCTLPPAGDASADESSQPEEIQAGPPLEAGGAKIGSSWRFTGWPGFKVCSIGRFLNRIQWFR